MSELEPRQENLQRSGFRGSTDAKAVLLLALIGCAGLTIVRVDAAWVPAIPVLQVSLTVLFVLLVRALCYRWSLLETRGVLFLLILLMTGSSFLIHAVTMHLWERSEPLETLLLACLQQTSLALVAFPTKPKWGQYSVAISGFLMVFTTAIADHRWVAVTAIAYVSAAVWWWMGEYWSRLSPGIKATGHRPLRRWRVGAMVGIVLLFLIASIAAPRRALRTLDGFMPTSGGNRSGDRNAQRGVGLGDLLVGAREQAQTFGPVDTDVFLESDQPTLYDMLNDEYGEPKKRRLVQRAIALSGEVFRQNHQKLSTSTEAGDAFSTDRESRSEKRAEEAKSGSDVLQVSGSVPLHLSVEHFDQFDGVTWTRSDSGPNSGEVESSGSLETEKTKEPRSVSTGASRPTIDLQWRFSEPWFHSSTFPSASWLVRGREHAVRVFRFSTSRLPLPPHAEAWHVDRVDRGDLFTHLEDGHVAFEGRETIPPLTVIEFSSQGHRPRALLSETWEKAARSSKTETDEDFDGEQEVAALAMSLAGKAPTGWRQIRAWIDGLRDWGRHSLDGLEDSSAETPLLQFLRTKQGPDYLFATVAVIGLRSMGYESRIASGFYVRPDRFDRTLGYTRVFANDVHLWCEVRTSDGIWIPLEPTPGYAETAEIFTFWDRVGAACEDLRSFVAQHYFVLLAILVSAVAVAWHRKRLVDLAICFIARWEMEISSHGPVRGVIRLLERRSSHLGKRRPPHVPLHRWYQWLGPIVTRRSAVTCSVEDWNRAWSLLDRSLYAGRYELTHDEKRLLRRLGKALCWLPRELFLGQSMSEKEAEPFVGRRGSTEQTSIEVSAMRVF